MGDSAITSDATTTTSTDASDEPPLFAHIRANEIGAGLPIHTPFGARATVYADYTASGRSLSFIEEYVAAHVLPTYGNTHTTTSKTGRQSSDFVAEARTMVRNYLRCGKHDNILFLGSGATAGANRLVAMLGLAAPPAARAAARARPEAERPIVFVGPYEHHSNLLPWRDSIADVVQIGEAAHGGPDLAQLQAALEAAAARPLRVGAFSAASNVSGALTDVDAVTALLHSHNALAIWDYASAAPHAPVCMNPPAAAAAHASLLAKDAVFFSPHKFPGGPQAAGVLVFKSHLAELYCKGTADGRRASVAPGGGSVFFVSRDAHVYARAEEAREEAGTPPIIGAVRVALCMQLQQAVGWRAIAQADERLLHRMAAAWGSHPNLALLGHGARAGASASPASAGAVFRRGPAPPSWSGTAGTGKRPGKAGTADAALCRAAAPASLELTRASGPAHMSSATRGGSPPHARRDPLCLRARGWSRRKLTCLFSPSNTRRERRDAKKFSERSTDRRRRHRSSVRRPGTIATKP